MNTNVTVYTDDGHVLELDLDNDGETDDASFELGNYLRPFFRSGVIVGRRDENIFYVPADRITCISIPVESLL